jgi:hypothetical protein
VAVPYCLAIVVGVDVDKAWRDQLALGIDFLSAILRNFADGGDAVALDADIGLDGCAAGAVHHGAVADDEIELWLHRDVPSAAALFRHCAPVVAVRHPAKAWGPAWDRCLRGGDWPAVIEQAVRHGLRDRP